MKKLFDLNLLLLTFPIWGSVILVYYILNIILEGFPGFYSSTRYFGNGRNVRIIKFRVMKRDIDKVLNRDSIPVGDKAFLNLPVNSNIYTKIGLIIERFGITELPQFFSVIKGDMSIVGARPLPYNVFKELHDKFPDIAKKRFESKCGLTGLPQLVGRDFISDRQRLELEIAYSDWSHHKYNLIVDAKIILYTVFIVLGLKKKETFETALNLLK
jgi:lipopolysaccharide/colanic/teichoic acid biosynthesis glycosyltransferase